MRTRSLFLVLFLSLMAASLSAQHQKFVINLSTPEGQLPSESRTSPTTRRRWR